MKTFSRTRFLTKYTAKKYKKTSIRYRKLDLTPNATCVVADVVGLLRKYYQKAHSDAKLIFMRSAGIVITKIPTQNPTRYPHSLPMKTKLGYFGEVLCGVLAEHFIKTSETKWMVPAFLFRCHKEASDYITKLSFGYPKIPGEVRGRIGDDFLAIAMDDQQKLKAILVGESKVRSKPKRRVAEEALVDLSAQKIHPVDLGQLADILRDEPSNSEIVSELERAVFSRSEASLARVDMLLCVAGTQRRQEIVPLKVCKTKYTGGRELVVVEVEIRPLHDVVRELYRRL